MWSKGHGCKYIIVADIKRAFEREKWVGYNHGWEKWGGNEILNRILFDETEMWWEDNEAKLDKQTWPRFLISVFFYYSFHCTHSEKLKNNFY